LASLPLLGLLNKRTQIVHFAWKNVKIRYRGSYLGLLWTALEPLLYFVFLYVVFTNIRIGVKEDFGIYLITGIVLYHTFVKGTQGGLGSLKENAGILSSINLRREFFPVVSTTTSSIMLLVEVGVLFALMPVFGFTPGWTIILLIPILLLLQTLILGFSYLLSIILVYAKDIQPLWSVFVHALIFVTPIFWYVEDMGGIALEIQKINPLGQLIEMAHKVVFGELPTINEWVYSTVIIFAILFVGYGIFQKLEKRVVERF
jgi:ABC-type polysaccharide/polyol phosphate export permease